ncbi:methyl farnesoate epoxidase [Folsomia candida]|uniref:methyl farnesoate epoxidase n=1 Tax=Folsomia candida TaxID=158441 RepID=UPI000B8FEBD4|nr:methyl farnesoate epoxidase [Folsomia candida]
MFATFFTCVVSALLIYYLLTKRRNRKLPPGPARYPILGNLPQMAKAHPFGYRAFHKLSEQYGEIMSVKVGLQEMVVLSSHKVMKAILDKDEVSGRLWTGILEDRSFGKELGIAFSSGDLQKQLKTFVIKALREFGFGKSASMESIVELELECMDKRLRSASKVNGGKVLMERFFQPSLMNVLWTMMAAKRYDHDDPKLTKLLEINSGWFQTGSFGSGIITAFPFIRFLFPEWTGYSSLMHGNRKIHQFARDIMQEHRSRGTYKTDPQSFVDVFLREIDNQDGDLTTAFTDEQFMIICYDMFQGGFETSSNTLAFAILYMILNPEVQTKVQEELDSVCPSKKTPILLSQRTKLTYTYATLMEAFRMSNILPISGPRKAMTDYTYDGYVIPKGTAITFNTYSVMRSKETWGDPDKFRPERFLNPDGGLNSLVDLIGISWGHGRRSCIGEILARTTVFMYFTYLLHNFSFRRVHDTKLPTTEPIYGIILSPQPYELIVEQRS